MNAIQLKRFRIPVLAAVLLAVAWTAGAQELTPPKPKPYFDEPAWVHERPPKLTDRVWHAKPAPDGTAAQPLKGVRIVDSGDEIVRRHDDGKTGQGAFNSHLGTTLVSGVDVDGSGKKNGRILYREFSLDIPFCGRPPVYDVEANSPIFYGGATTFLAGEKGGGFEEFGINTGEGKNWTFIAPDSAIRSLMYGVWLWKKEDFRYGGDENRVSFDETSRIGLHVMRYMWRLDELRYVVQDGDRFYISEYNCGTLEAQAFFDGKNVDVNNPAASGLSPHTVGTGGGVVFGMKPTETRWARYEPKAPYHIDFDHDKAVYEEHTFKDVRAVGFYIAKNTWAPKAMAIKWYGFEVLGTVRIRRRNRLPTRPGTRRAPRTCMVSGLLT